MTHSIRPVAGLLAAGLLALSFAACAPAPGGTPEDTEAPSASDTAVPSDTDPATTADTQTEPGTSAPAETETMPAPAILSAVPSVTGLEPGEDGAVPSLTVYGDSCTLSVSCPGAVSLRAAVEDFDHTPAPDETGTASPIPVTDGALTLTELAVGHTCRVTVTASDADGNESRPAVCCVVCAPYVVTDAEIARAAEAYNIKPGSTAYEALLDVNRVYGKTLQKRLNETLIFFFEGVGVRFSLRYSALCVVVRDGEIRFADRKSSTVPDYPFDPSRNNGNDMGTVVDGIYVYTTVDHNGQYASLNINTPHLVRFRNQTDFYTCDNGYGFDIHRRYSNGIAGADDDWVNSAGCFLVGAAGSGPYTPFVKAVGLIPEDARELTVAQTEVTGHVIIDRYYAVDFLQSLGYPDKAISLIRKRALAARK